MSIDAMTDLWGENDLTPAQWKVAMAVADTVNDAHDNQFWMRSGPLALKCGISDDATRHRLSELVKAGWLEVVEQGGGRGQATRYRWLGKPCRENTETENRVQSTAETVSRVPETVSREHSDTSIYNPTTQGLNPRVFEGGFDDFWARYPRRVGRRQALRAWVAAHKRCGTTDLIFYGLERMLPQWSRTETKYVPHPATWLNRDGWLDEPDADAEVLREAAGVIDAFDRLGLGDDDERGPHPRAIGAGR